MLADATVLYTLNKQIKNLQRDNLEVLLHAFLSTDLRTQNKLELDNEINIQPAVQPVLFSKNLSLNTSKQDKKADEHEQKPSAPKPKA